MNARNRMLICYLFAILIAFPMLASAQETEAVLVSANVPWYPVLARQSGLDGTVRLRFTLPAHGTTASSVEVLSGPPLLGNAAMENVKTWRFDNPYAVERKYETTFTYRIIGEDLSKRVVVAFDTFRKVEVYAYTPPPMVTH